MNFTWGNAIGRLSGNFPFRRVRILWISSECIGRNASIIRPTVFTSVRLLQLVINKLILLVMVYILEHFFQNSVRILRYILFYWALHNLQKEKVTKNCCCIRGEEDRKSTESRGMYAFKIHTNIYTHRESFVYVKWVLSQRKYIWKRYLQIFQKKVKLWNRRNEWER